jgi:hypothetical protein
MSSAAGLASAATAMAASAAFGCCELQSLLHFGRVSGVSPSAVARRSGTKQAHCGVYGYADGSSRSKPIGRSSASRCGHLTAHHCSREEAFHRIPGEIFALHLLSVRRDRLLSWPARNTALSLGPASLIVEGMRKAGLPEGAVKTS